MNRFQTDGRCGFKGDSESARCPRKEDVRFLLILMGPRGKYEALLPISACSEHSSVLPQMALSMSPIEQLRFQRSPGVQEAIKAFQDHFHEDPTEATVAVLGLDSDEYRAYAHVAEAIVDGRGNVPVSTIVEVAREDDVKADLGEKAFNETLRRKLS